MFARHEGNIGIYLGVSVIQIFYVLCFIFQVGCNIGLYLGVSVIQQIFYSYTLYSRLGVILDYIWVYLLSSRYSFHYTLYSRLGVILDYIWVYLLSLLWIFYSLYFIFQVGGNIGLYLGVSVIQQISYSYTLYSRLGVILDYIWVYLLSLLWIFYSLYFINLNILSKYSVQDHSNKYIIQNFYLTDCRIQSVQFRMQSVEFEVLSVQCRVYNVEHSFKCRVPSVECRIQRTMYSEQHRMQTVEWILSHLVDCSVKVQGYSLKISL